MKGMKKIFGFRYKDSCLQHDGHIAHNANKTINALNNDFPNFIIDWLGNSPDLNPSNLLYIKS